MDHDPRATTRCVVHPYAPAGWRCGRCARTLCPDCVATDDYRGTPVVRCVSCGGLAAPLLVPRDRTPYWRLGGAYARALFSKAGLWALLATALPLYLLGGLLGVLPIGVAMLPILVVLGLAYLGVFATYVFVVVRVTADGEIRAPDIDDITMVEGYVSTGIAFLVAAVGIWVPLLVVAALRIGAGALVEDPTRLVSDPLLLAMAAVTALYAPGALLVAAVTGSALAVLDPRRVVGLVRAIPRDYTATTAVLFVLGVVHGLVVSGAGWLLGHVPLPILPSVVLEVVALVVPSFAGFVLGRLVFQNDDVLGYGDPRHRLVPVLPGAVPRARLPETKRALAEVAETGHEDGVALVDSPEAPARDVAPAPRAPDEASIALSAPEPVLPTSLRPPAAPTGRPAAPLALLAGMRRGGERAAPVADDPHAALFEEHDVRPATPAARADTVAEELVDLAEAADAPAAARAELRRAVVAGGAEAALAAVRALGAVGGTPDLAPALELRLAGLLDRAGDPGAAVEACRRAARAAPDGPLAPRAVLLAGELFADRLGRPEEAARLFAHVVERYPGDPAAARARERLTAGV